MTTKDALRTLIRVAGYDIRRRGQANRFNAMDDALRHLAARYFCPQTVIDVGANEGHWTELALGHFPNATYHLIEPQPACLPALRALAGRHARLSIHACAATKAESDQVRLVGHGTGAFIGTGTEGQVGSLCPATKLDRLLLPALEDGEILLKLDIQGHELEALSGGRDTLMRSTVVISEVAFFPIGENEGRATPSFEDYFEFFHGAGFTLYDVAALAHRWRDQRLAQGDLVFVRKGHPLLADNTWE